MPLPNPTTATFAPIGSSPFSVRRYAQRVIARPAAQVAPVVSAQMTPDETRELMIVLGLNVLGFAVGALLGYRVVTRACRIED
jgi:hypothetical protein